MLQASKSATTLAQMGVGSGIPDATYAEVASIILSSGRRDQALDMSIEVLSVAEGAHQVLFIPWMGTQRHTFGALPAETGSTYQYVCFKEIEGAKGVFKGLQGLEEGMPCFAKPHLKPWFLKPLI